MGVSGVPGREQGGQHASDRAQAAVESEFGGEYAAVQRGGGYRAGGGEDGDGDGQVEAGAVARRQAEVAGCKVTVIFRAGHGFQPLLSDGGIDPVPGLPDRSFGQSR